MKGFSRPSSDKPMLDFNVNFQGLTLQPIKPYIDGMKLSSCDVTSSDVLWRSGMRRKGGTGGGGWVHLKGANVIDCPVHDPCSFCSMSRFAVL